MAQNIKKIISTTAKLPGGAQHWIYRTAISKAHAVSKPALKLSEKADQTGESQIITIGTQPDGFGSGFIWDRQFDEVLLAVFINAADPIGISIDGLDMYDVIEVTSASGIASFDEDKGNPTAGSLVGLIAAAAKVGATLAGYPEAVPLIDAGETFAQNQFKATNAKTMKRDPFGQDPESGAQARAEGGVLVCMPAANGPYYSGDSDHKARWIKDTKPRTYENLPGDIAPGSAFFLNRTQGYNQMQSLISGGQAYLLAWDHVFDDNAGYYKLFVKISKNKGPLSDGPLL